MKKRAGSDDLLGEGPRPLRRLFRNAGVLTAGNVASSLLAFLYTLITARVLGPGRFGELVLITTYVLLVDKIVNFQSWQALIKYGAQAKHRGPKSELLRVVKLGASVDLATALAGAVVAAALAPIIGSYFEWGSSTVLLASVYSLVVLSHVSGTPTAVLRLFDRFDLLSVHLFAMAGIKLVGVGIAALVRPDVFGFLLAWGAADVLGNALLLSFGRWQLNREGYRGLREVRLRGISARHPGIWSFLWTTNLSGSIRTVAREVDVLLVGGLAGEVGAGLYKIAKQFAAVVAKLTDPLYQAIYPDLARLYADGKIASMRSLIGKSSLMMGAITAAGWAVFLFFGPMILRLTVGPQYLGAHPVLVWYMSGVVVAIFGYALQPAMLASGRARLSLAVHFGSTVLYIPAMIILLNLNGVVGAGQAYLFYYLLWTVIMLLLQFDLLFGHSANEKSRAPRRPSHP